MTSSRHPTSSAINRPVIIEDSRFERTAAAATGAVGCTAVAAAAAVVAVEGGDLVIADTTFAGVGGGAAVSFEPSSLGGNVNRLEVRSMRF